MEYSWNITMILNNTNCMDQTKRASKCTETVFFKWNIWGIALSPLLCPFLLNMFISVTQVLELVDWQNKYRTHAIISRGLYIFYPIFKDHFFVFKTVCGLKFQKKCTLLGECFFVQITVGNPVANSHPCMLLGRINSWPCKKS